MIFFFVQNHVAAGLATRFVSALSIVEKKIKFAIRDLNLKNSGYVRLSDCD